MLEWRGATLSDINDGDLIDALGGYDEGVVFLTVPSDSQAYEMGFRTSDVIINWGEDSIRTLEELERALERSNESQVQIVIIRNYEKMTFIID